MKPIDSCPVCSSKRHRTVRTMTLEAKDFEHPEDTLRKTNNYHRNWLLFDRVLPDQTTEITARFLSCRECSVVFFSPRPDDQDMELKYAAVQTDQDTEAREQLGVRVDTRRERSGAIRERLDGITFTGGGVLDIGGADGHCLDAFVADGPGYVSDYEDREMWPGVEYLGPPPIPESKIGTLDAILMCHIVEHLVDPVAELRRHAEFLRPGGSLYVEVPFAWILEPFWTRNLLTHINFFSARSVRRLIAEVGLEVVDVRVDSVLSSSRALPVVWVHARRSEPVGAHQPNRTMAALRGAVDVALLLPRLVRDNVRIIVRR